MAQHFSPTSPNFTLFATKNDFLFSRPCCSFLSASRPRDDLFYPLSSLSFPFPYSVLLTLSSSPSSSPLCAFASRLTERTYKKISATNSAASSPATASLTPDTPSLVISVWRTREPPAEPQPAPLTTTAIFHHPTRHSPVTMFRRYALGFSNVGRQFSTMGSATPLEDAIRAKVCDFHFTLIQFTFFASCILLLRLLFSCANACIIR